LREVLGLGPSPSVEDGGVWEGFPEASATDRRGLMIDLSAQEAMVVEPFLCDQDIGRRPVRPADDYLRASLFAPWFVVVSRSAA